MAVLCGLGLRVHGDGGLLWDLLQLGISLQSIAQLHPFPSHGIRYDVRCLNIPDGKEAQFK